MSRIQQILDKAERDGGIVRMRSVSEPEAADAPIAFDTAGAGVGLSEHSVDADEHEAAATGLVPGRIVRSARLDPVLVAALEPGAPAAEQYRALRTRVAQSEHPSSIDLLLVTSPGRGEGKSVTAANLGLTMAQDFQRRICVVDADMRHSRLHELFGLAGAPGLSELLTGEVSLLEALIEIEDQQITLLPAGRLPAHPAELLGSNAMRRLIQELRAHFDRVIFDAPAATPLADVGILAPLVDSVVLVVRAGVTTKPAIQEAVSAIGPERVLGVVLNDTAN
jgi:capsular exopolysaccharide synthesis family protein